MLRKSRPERQRAGRRARRAAQAKVARSGPTGADRSVASPASLGADSRLERAAPPARPATEQAAPEARATDGARLRSAAVEHALNLTGQLRQELLSLEGFELEAEQHDYDVVVPVCGGAAVVRRCLDSVLQWTHPRHRIIVVDDASPDEETGSLLAELEAQHGRVQVHRLEKNVGFVGAVNHALERTERDVILLNSDTEVPEHWVARLDRCRRSSPALAAISPLSNNATLCSVPHLGRGGGLPTGTSLAEMDRLVATTSLRRYPRVPTCVGFCMLITRRALSQVGHFDPAFGKGYGEEVDFCQRSWALGFECAICDDLYVYHEGEASFSHLPEKRQLQQRNERMLAERYPAYHRNVIAFYSLNPLGFQQKRLMVELERLSGRAKPVRPGAPRLLHVVHDFESRTGTAGFVRKLVAHFADGPPQALLCSAACRRAVDEELRREAGVLQIRFNPLCTPVEHVLRGGSLRLRSAAAERAFAETLLAIRPTVVHFSHLANLGSWLLPSIARALGARVALVLHDYYLLCPDWNLLDPHGKACGRALADESAQCEGCLRGKLQSAPGARALPLHPWLAERNGLARLAAEQAHVLIAPSQFVKQQFSRAWGPELADRIEVIGHGGPDGPPTTRADKPRASRLRAAFLGNFLPEKGSATFTEAANLLRGEDVELSVVGAVGSQAPPLPPHVRLRGAYAPGQLPVLLSEVDVVVIASTWHETYCIAVDEALKANTVVVASDVGAVRERIRDGENGLLFEPGNASSLAAQLRRLRQEGGLLERLSDGVRRTSLTTESQSLARYARALLGEPPGCIRSALMTDLMRQTAVPRAAAASRQLQPRA